MRGAVGERVVTLALDGDQEIAGGGKREREFAAGTSFRGPAFGVAGDVGAWSGMERDNGAADRRFVFIDDAAGEGYIGGGERYEGAKQDYYGNATAKNTTVLLRDYQKCS